MTPFLKQVARHFVAEGGLEHLCFIFPNRRSMVFFRKYLHEEASALHRSVVVPRCLPMNDFIHETCSARTTSKIVLILKLYDCYKSLNPDAESLDDFVYWGDVLLSDFDDVDKYMADPKGLFTNAADLKNMQGDCSYLTQTQLKAVSRLLGRDPGDSRYKGRFLHIWNLLLPLYLSFRKKLEDEGLAYEGMVYRSVAQRLRSGEPARDVFSERFPGLDFVFVGLNTLNTCEKTILSRLRDAGMARFCWDFSSAMIRNERNRATFFMKDNVRDYPQAFEFDSDGLPAPDITVVSVPSSVGQAKLLPQILSRIGGGGLDTALVLPDENLLIPVLHSIPEEVGDVNVTMGYPIQGSGMFSLLGCISALQLHTRDNGGTLCFHNVQVLNLLSNSVLRSNLTSDGLLRCKEVRSSGKFYIPESDFKGADPLLDEVFRCVVLPSSEAGDNAGLNSYLRRFTEMLIDRMEDAPDMEMEKEFAQRVLKALNLLSSFVDRPMLPSTYLHLLTQMLGVESVPFEGEPLKGLQIMGPLETRALDFDNLIILSCNEGVFPRRSVSASFIPPELRKAFDLPTYIHQDAMWAYYFYRMIQRASRIWMLYDSREENLRSGEESRFIKQLELHFGQKFERLTARATVSGAAAAENIPKSARDMEMIRQFVYSASSIQDYLSCPAKFYFNDILRLKDEEDPHESMDAGMLGSVFHSVMEKLYEVPAGEPCRVIDRSYLESLRSGRDYVERLVDEGIREKMKTFEVRGKDLIYKDLLCRYVDRTLRADLDLMQERGTGSFTVFGVEKLRRMSMDGYEFKGYIDRMDSFSPGEVRVVDYKTGTVSDMELDITDDNASLVVDRLFDPDPIKDRPKIAVQLYLYDCLVAPEVGGRKLFNSVYALGRIFREGVRQSEVSGKFCREMQPRLKALLDEISDPAVPFDRRISEDNCKYCDFKMICGR